VLAEPTDARDHTCDGFSRLAEKEPRQPEEAPKEQLSSSAIACLGVDRHKQIGRERGLDVGLHDLLRVVCRTEPEELVIF